VTRAFKLRSYRERPCLTATLTRSLKLTCYSDQGARGVFVPPGAYPAASAPCPRGTEAEWLVLAYRGVLLGTRRVLAAIKGIEITEYEPEPPEASGDPQDNGSACDDDVPF
jgi:hypothetical protein